MWTGNDEFVILTVRVADTLNESKKKKLQKIGVFKKFLKSSLVKVEAQPLVAGFRLDLRVYGRENPKVAWSWSLPGRCCADLPVTTRYEPAAVQECATEDETLQADSFAVG